MRAGSVRNTMLSGLFALFFLASFLFAAPVRANDASYFFNSDGQAYAACLASRDEIRIAHNKPSCQCNADGGRYSIVGSSCAYHTHYYYWRGTYTGNACELYGGASNNWNVQGQCTTASYSASDCAIQNGISDGGGSCNACPSGLFPNEAGTACVTPTCDLGQVWNGTACGYPESPSCSDSQIAVVNSSGVTIGCHDTADIDQECDYSLGYGSDGYFLCSDKKAECEAAGGTHGYVDGNESCIPAGYSPPICDSKQAVMMTGGGFVCSTPATVKPQNPDDVVDPSNAPTVPGETSTTPSGQSAAPGTGTAGGGSGGTGTPEAPAIEAHEGTREAGKTGEGRASGSCVTPPVCSGGDPQVCALLRQQWEAMCKTPDMLENLDGNQAQTIVQSVEAGIDGVFAGTGPADVVGTVVADPTGGVGSAAEMGWFETFVADLVPSGTSCTSYSMNMPRVVLVFGCERLDWLKSFLGWMLYCYTVFFVWGTVFAPYKAPAGG